MDTCTEYEARWYIRTRALIMRLGGKKNTCTNNVVRRKNGHVY